MSLELAELMGTRAIADASSKAIYDNLVAWIVEGRLPEGARLPTERELAERFGAARNTVRKTMNRLVSEGLVVRYVGRGSFVSPKAEIRANGLDAEPSTFDLPELLEARILFEPALAELAAERASDEELLALGGKLDLLQAARNWKAFKEAKYDLHLAVAVIARNSFLEQVFRQIIASRRAAAWRRPGPTVSFSVLHEAACADNREIVEALQRRDGKAAGALARNNLLKVLVSIAGS